MKFENLTDAQKKVFVAARKRLKKYSWFGGVCTDNFPSDKKCIENFDRAVNSVIDETAMWDCPNW